MSRLEEICCWFIFGSIVGGITYALAIWVWGLVMLIPVGILIYEIDTNNKKEQ